MRRIVFSVDNKKRKVTIFDTTLRDGEQTPGVSFTKVQKCAIAGELSSLGVHFIEAGFPASSESERDTVREIAHIGLNSKICGLSRSVQADVDACLDCDVDMVHVFIPTSEVQRMHTIRKSPEEVIEITGNIIRYVRDHIGLCMFSAMDATRTDPQFLIDVCKAADDAGATIINVPDTVGIYTPNRMHKLITGLLSHVQCPLDVHCHNDFGLAVANTVAAVNAGASQMQVTVNGMGERAGNADLAQSVMILESIEGISTGIKTEHLVPVSKLVSRYSGLSIPPIQPVVGDNAFSHESGIHSHGVIACSATFEPGIMTPEMVGHKRRLTLGKHVGRHAVRQMLEEVHIHPGDVELDQIVDKIKFISGKGKRITDADLYEIADSVTGTANGSRTIILEDFAVMTGNHVLPTASVRALVNGKKETYSSTGTGPVDAALNAILGMSPFRVQLKEFRVEAISGGSDAIGHVTIAVEDEGGSTFDASASGDDIVLASAEAMINALNLLYRIREQKKNP